MEIGGVDNRDGRCICFKEEIAVVQSFLCIRVGSVAEYETGKFVKPRNRLTAAPCNDESISCRSFVVIDKIIAGTEINSGITTVEKINFIGVGSLNRGVTAETFHRVGIRTAVNRDEIRIVDNRIFACIAENCILSLTFDRDFVVAFAAVDQHAIAIANYNFIFSAVAV